MNTKPQNSNIFDTGLPIPVVVVSVAVSNEQYGTDRVLVANSVSYACIYVYIYNVDVGYQMRMVQYGHSLLQCYSLLWFVW